MSQQGVYSEMKMPWWYVREGRLPDAPKQVQLILSDLCNQDCVWCAYRVSGNPSNELFLGDSEAAGYGKNNPKRRIPTDRALRFLDEFKEAGVLSVQFTGGGEPTVHPEHEVIFSQALELGLRCSLVSNGVKWSYSLIKDILPRFDWVRVSIDAGDSGSYSKTRNTPTKNWDAVWEHVRTLSAAIAANNSPTAFGLGFVVTPDSYEEIPAFTALAKAAGVGNVRFTAMFGPEEEKPYNIIYDEVHRLIAKARKIHQSDSFMVYDNFGSRVDDLRQHSPDYELCSYQYYTSYIGGDMNSYRCCILAYNKRGQVQGGNLSERSFSDYWKSQERKDDFASLDARGCPRCQFNTKNRQMIYITGNTQSDTSPRHMEWP